MDGRSTMMSRARRRVVPVAPARIDDNRGRLDRQGTDPWPSRPGRLSAQGRRVKIAIRRSPGKLAGVKHRVITWWRSGPAWSSARRWPSWRLGRPADHRLVAGAAGATDRHGNAREVREACTFPEGWRVREAMSGFTMPATTSAGRCGRSMNETTWSVHGVGHRRWRLSWPTTSGLCEGGSRCPASNTVGTPPGPRSLHRSVRTRYDGLRSRNRMIRGPWATFGEPVPYLGVVGSSRPFAR